MDLNLGMSGCDVIVLTTTTRLKVSAYHSKTFKNNNSEIQGKLILKNEFLFLIDTSLKVFGETIARVVTLIIIHH